MGTFIAVIHITVCIALICIVLLQSGKGASLGAAFGGATQTVFGASGGAGFFEKLTTAIAVIFMVTSVLLTFISAKRGGETIMKPRAAHEEKAVPKIPQAPGTGAGQKAPSTMPATPSSPQK
jgi:preprotein translocase subunit SecG